jgi:hypothetical protein
MGRQRTIALHKVNVRLLERAWGFAKFSAFFLVVLTANHKPAGWVWYLLCGVPDSDQGL